MQNKELSPIGHIFGKSHTTYFNGDIATTL